MSLCINTVTPEGIVFAADSRQSYRNQKGMSRVGSDSASKIFKLNERIGVTVAGLAFLPENDVPKNISQFISDFKKNNDLSKISVEKVASKLNDFFEKKYNYAEHLDQLEKQIKSNLAVQNCELLELKREDTHIEFRFKNPKGIQQKGVSGVDQLQFIVAGFNIDDSHQSVMVYVPGKVELKRDSNNKGNQYGAGWIGQTDVVGRIVLGFDPRISNMPFVENSVEKLGKDQVHGQLKSLEYVIQWGTMTLQDGIDFSRLAIETTSAIQRFSDGIKANPGDMPGVGGHIDVAVITPDHGFVWVSKKDLVAGDDSLDLENMKKTNGKS